MIKLGTVGTSAITESFLTSVALSGKFEHYAVYSRSLETGNAFAKKQGAKKVFCDLAEMAECGIEAVYIASPNVFHADQSRIFLEHGVHVICEKPIATSYADYCKLKALADSKGLIYMEAIIPRHTEWYDTVKDAVSKIGKISMARIDYSQLTSRLPQYLRGEHINIFDMSLHAGTLMDLGVYCVYGAVDLLGEPKSITAMAQYLPNGADCSGAALFDYGDFPAVISYSKMGQAGFGSELIGMEGTLKIRMISQYTGVTLVKEGRETELVGMKTKAELMRGEAAKLAEYITCPETGADYAKASELCAAVHRCMDKIRQSAGINYPALKK